jgi:hypothetical protein
VTPEIDRMWAVRDAVLRWLYVLAAQGNRHPTLDLEHIREVAGWSADPLQPDEIDTATRYLKDEGLIDGEDSWGGRISRLVITSRGERKAAEGTSVRPGPPRPANPTGHVFNTVHNYGSGNFNVGGRTESQVMGDNFKDVGAGAVIVNRSTLTNALNRLDTQHNAEAAAALKVVAQRVEESGNEEAGDLLDGFMEELDQLEPRKGRLRSF